MDVSLASWFVILLALFCANLPFFNERLFAVIPVRRAIKPVWWRLLELLALYFFVGVVARLMESRIGSVFSQGWEFYAVSGCLFLVFAYPGFVLCYLRRKRR